MPVIWKEVLCKGVQKDARGNWFTINDRNIRAAEANAKKMLQRGVPVPCVWEHINHEAGKEPPEAWRAWYAKNTFSHVQDARINERGNLDLALPVNSQADIEQLKNVKFVSPKIYDGYSDTRGGRYHDTTITHVAATPSPVQYWQEPFNVQLSEYGVLYLSFLPPSENVHAGQTRTAARATRPMPQPTNNNGRRAAYTPPAAARPAPNRPVSTPTNATNRGRALARGGSDDDGDSDRGTSRDRGGRGDSDRGASRDTGGGSGDRSGSSGGYSGRCTLQDVMDALREKGWNIPDEVTDEHELCIAIKSQDAPAPEPSADEMPAAPGDPNAAAKPGVTNAGGPPMMMSVTSRDPKLAQRAKDWNVNDKRIIKERIRKCYETGRITRKLALDLSREVDSINLSYTLDGKVAPDPVSGKVAAYEALGQWSAWKPTGAQPRPLSTSGGDTGPLTRPVSSPGTLGNMPNHAAKPEPVDASGNPIPAQDRAEAAKSFVLSFIDGPDPKPKTA